MRSGFVLLGGQGLQILVMLVSAVTLARLVPPRDFGLFAMVVSLTAIVGSVRGFGLHFAAVQAQELPPEDAGALFWVNLKLTALSGLFVAAMAPALAWFYGQERLLGLTVVGAAAIFAHGTSALHEALLMRSMRFGILQAIELGAQLAGLAVAVLAALAGLGAGALVLQMLGYSVAKAATVFVAAPWAPLRGERPAGLSRLLDFGRQYSAFFVLSNAARLDRVLIGYLHGATPLGLYDNAFRWSHHPVQQLFPPLTRVAVAGLSRLQSDARAYAAAARRSLLPVFSLFVPALAYLALEADVVIPALLGERWRGAVPFFRVLCLAAVATGIRQATHWLYLSTGDMRRQTWWSAVSLPFLWLGAIVGARWGPMGVAVGTTAATWALLYPTVAYCLRSSPLTMRAFLGTLSLPAVASAAGAAALLAARLAGEPGPLVRAALFAGVYAAVWRLLPGGRRGWSELVAMARHLPTSRR